MKKNWRHLEIKIVGIKMAKEPQTIQRDWTLKRHLECFLHSVKWQVTVGVLGYSAVQLHVLLSVSSSRRPFNPTGPSGTARPATDARRRRPCRGCWCCCRCCPGTCPPRGPGGRDPRRRWTPCWSAPPTASTSPGWRHSASGWTLGEGKKEEKKCEESSNQTEIKNGNANFDQYTSVPDGGGFLFFYLWW